MTAPVAKRRQHGSRATAYPWLRYVVLGASAALGFTIVYGQTLVSQVDRSFSTPDVEAIITNRPQKPIDGDAGEALNILLLASDARDGENGDIGGDFEGMRNDTTIIMHISGDRERVEMLSIPRDTQVPISDCTLLDGRLQHCVC